MISGFRGEIGKQKLPNAGFPSLIRHQLSGTGAGQSQAVNQFFGLFHNFNGDVFKTKRWII